MQDRPLSDALICDLLGQQFPRLTLHRLISFDSGGHVVAIVNDDLIFRFPKDANEAAKVAREVRFLTEVGPALPLPVPSMDYVGRPSARYPFPFTGHRMLPGSMGEERRPDRQHWPVLARQLGTFFSVLHRVPRPQADRLGLPRQPLELLLAQLRCAFTAA